MKNKNKHVIFKFFIILLTFLTFTNKVPYLCNEVYATEDDEKTIALKNQFQEVLHSLFLSKNAAILYEDTETLKSFYDTNLQTGLWSYESEMKKIKYFSNWSEKQGAEFTDIFSTLKISKVDVIGGDVFDIVCYVSTEFIYNYFDEPFVENRFKLGTCHSITLRKENDSFKISKEWYTDPLADSLNLENIKSDEIKDFILASKKPDWSPDERTQKALDYAHRYCGVSDDPEFLFKYNKDYKNFNPEGGDCANFASQILFEGGNFKKNKTWNYANREGTKAWLNAQGFKQYIVNSGRGSNIASGSYSQTYKAAFQLRPGDFVAYEKKGRITHISTVTGLDSKGYPLVTCHNSDRLLVPYDLGWSNSNITFHFVDVHY